MTTEDKLRIVEISPNHLISMPEQWWDWHQTVLAKAREEEGRSITHPGFAQAFYEANK